MVEQTAYTKQMPSSTEGKDMDEGQELSHHIFYHVLEFGETVLLPTDSSRHAATDYAYDNPFHLSLYPDIVQQISQSVRSEVSIMEKTKESTMTPTTHTTYRPKNFDNLF